jgi:hypothetical protein
MIERLRPQSVGYREGQKTGFRKILEIRLKIVAFLTGRD